MADQQRELITQEKSDSATKPISELASIDKLAIRLAREHTVVHRAGHPHPILQSPKNYEALVERAVQGFRSLPVEEIQLGYAAEWILDNYYIVLEDIRQVNHDMPPGYYRLLPILEGGPLDNYPRVYALAREIIQALPGSAEIEPLTRFIQVYQASSPLEMGELWALPTMIRLAILERLFITVDQMLGLQDPRAAQLSEKLGLAALQANPEVVSNSILSLRAIDREDWKLFFESLSLVEQYLRGDPAGVYANMDFTSRNRYREAVEDLSRGSGISELEVARQALVFAQAETKNRTKGGTTWDPKFGKIPPRNTHVGYYLISGGRRALEDRLNYKPGRLASIRRWLFAHPTPIYLGSIGILSLGILLVLILYTLQSGGRFFSSMMVGLLLLIPALIFAESIVSWIATILVPPRILPKIELEEGVPRAFTTMVVMPVLLTDADGIHEMLQQLELHYLRNQSSNLYFALLADLPDAHKATLPSDTPLIDQAINGVQKLNDRYREQASPPFYVFIRERVWSSGENKWMGWERKRGKLHEFNQLIRGGGQTSYYILEGDLTVIKNIQFVITLDADTILPRETAVQLIGTLAHPLNRAKFDRNTGKVTAGYTILQPRVAVSPTSVNASIFARIFGGNPGLDLYSLAVSDVYQDLFAEGIFVGKGIYAVDAFERSLAGRVPENALLSHDLFEGLQGRAGLVSDLTLIEDYPSHYLGHARRMHRWARGDWQLLPWLFSRVPAAGSEKIPNNLDTIDRWKIFDNLLRSLIPPFVFSLLVLGWTILPGSPWVWTLAALLAPGAPVITSLVGFIRNLIQDSSISQSLIPIREAVLRWLLNLVFLPFEALLLLGAILTTLHRLLVTRRNLLEWTPAAHTEKLIGQSTPGRVAWREMALSVGLAILIAVLIAATDLNTIYVALPFMIVWILAPQIAAWISQPIEQKPAALTPEDKAVLRRLARRTWLFFEQYVGPEDHWLPPDHYQENPLGVVAHRTSPTNIGIYMISTLGAYDLGYISQVDLVARLGSSFETMGQLARYRGHLLNWYDTRTLEPLLPEYVSTVDSGNLSACLLVVKQGCANMDRDPILSWRSWEGLLDTLGLVNDVLDRMKNSQPRVDVSELLAQIKQIREEILAVRWTSDDWISLLVKFREETWPRFAERLLALLERETSQIDQETLRLLRIFTKQFRQDLNNRIRTVDLLLPWLLYFNPAPAFFSNEDTPLEIRLAWQALVAILPSAPTPAEAEQACIRGQVQIDRLETLLEAQSQGVYTAEIKNACDWCLRLKQALDSARLNIKAMMIGLRELERSADQYFWEMDYSFLFDSRRKIFRIGYNVTAGISDHNYYDLLASEARIASLIAIAKGDVPQDHWLYLHRPLTQMDGSMALLSWSATMFEYLMPELFVQSYPGTLIHQSVIAAVERQIAYGKEKKVPWGISESGYYAFDANQNYQYRAFGVPGLGLKRGLGKDLVIAPYASLLALPIQPRAVIDNLAHLRQFNMMGTYGLFEAIDFTIPRMSLGMEYGIVRSYMAHHQGMILLSLANYLDGFKMVERFHAEPLIQSVELLLQEQIPQNAPLENLHSENGRVPDFDKVNVNTSPWLVNARSNLPVIHLLSNGRYLVMLTNAGSGFSKWRERDITRWRSDTTLDAYGSFIYVQDLDRGTVWSAGIQPMGHFPDSGEVLFSPHKAEFRRHDNDISMVLEVVVPPEDDVEIRRVTLTNHSSQTRRLRLLSYGEVILSPQTTDVHHPAFNKLFIESEYLHEQHALLFRRRPREETEDRIFMAHMIVCQAPLTPSDDYESDRNKFIGRGRSIRNPQALEQPGSLSKTTGATLDPIFSLSQWIELEPHGTIQVAYLTMAAATRSELFSLITHYQAWQSLSQAFDQSRNSTEVQSRRDGLNSPQQAQIEQLLSVLVYPYRGLRAPAETLRANVRGQSGLWAFGISGDFPILLVKVGDLKGSNILQEVLQAHTYWRNRQFEIDLVIINQQGTNYGQELHNQIFRLIQRSHSEAWMNRRGGIFLLQADQIDPESLILLQTAARVILEGDRGSLEEQLRVLEQPTEELPLLHLSSGFSPGAAAEPTPPLPRPEGLIFDNGLAGFSPDGKEYVIYLEPQQWTPAPWINVVASQNFGFMTSESGGGNTWAINSGENRLTPWRNDPVQDPPSEVIYLRDEETGQIWTPTLLPAGAPVPYLIRHAPGYSTFELQSNDLKQQLTLYAAKDDPVKILRLRLENNLDRPRRITATFYLEWVLGTLREDNSGYILPEYEADTQAVLARNPYHPFLYERVAFAAASKRLHGLTTDRTEFLGRLGSLSQPAALERIGLSGNIEPGRDACAALQVHLDLSPNQTEEVYFLLGQGENKDNALELVKRYQNPQEAEKAWADVTRNWDEILSTVTVRTPDPAMDLLLNQWLPYQALSCRIWGRSALYQSSGAFGYRDQLQDVMSMLYARPDIAREHILNAAMHQFEAGDVLHWWHPPQPRGVRTRCSDDLLWLPHVTAHYIKTTGDLSILSEEIPFLVGPALKPNEDEHYGHFSWTSKTYSLYEHCKRAIERGSTAGPHSLPLIGSGDWNDGMNRVGIEGQGESIWLSWFLIDTLKQFSEVCGLIGEIDQAEEYRNRALQLSRAVEEHGWDGEWYLRAFYDDGTPLGSHRNRECQIDSIAQSWAVLSGAGDPARAKKAMGAVLERLVRWDEGLILLFTPPFDQTARDPGYIKGYLPGIRENGGQYTHAALWTIWAFAEMGEGDLAGSLFSLINPILRADNPESVEKYKVEPYVIAADVYGVPPHTGRGGWTWYTGSSGWMYRLGLEAILGFQRQGEHLIIDPCIPAGWHGYEIRYQMGAATYHIQIENPEGVNRGVKEVTLDGQLLTEARIPLQQDGEEHQVKVILGR